MRKSRYDNKNRLPCHNCWGNSGRGHKFGVPLPKKPPAPPPEKAPETPKGLGAVARIVRSPGNWAQRSFMGVVLDGILDCQNMATIDCRDGIPLDIGGKALDFDGIVILNLRKGDLQKILAVIAHNHAERDTRWVVFVDGPLGEMKLSLGPWQGLSG